MMLKPMGLFATPASTEDLMDYCRSFPAGPERVAAMTVMGMTWNLCASLTNAPSSWTVTALSMSLDQGLGELCIPQDKFTQWFVGADCEFKRMARIHELSTALAATLTETDLPRLQEVCAMVNDRLADLIGGEFFEGNDLGNNAIVAHFTALCKEL